VIYCPNIRAVKNHANRPAADRKGLNQVWIVQRLTDHGNGKEKAGAETNHVGDQGSSGSFHNLVFIGSNVDLQIWHALVLDTNRFSDLA